MDYREQVTAVALEALRGDAHLEQRPGYCLRLVRQVVERALGLDPGSFYRLVRRHFRRREGERVQPYWARGAERALRAARLVKKSPPEPGDLLFSHLASWPYGHVGIMVLPGLVLENTTVSYRGWRHRGHGAVHLTPLREWDEVTTLIDGARLARALLEEVRR